MDFSDRYVVLLFPAYLHKSISGAARANMSDLLEISGEGFGELAREQMKQNGKPHLHLCFARYLHRDRDSLSIKERRRKKRGINYLVKSKDH